MKKIVNTIANPIFKEERGLLFVNTIVKLIFGAFMFVMFITTLALYLSKADFTDGKEALKRLDFYVILAAAIIGWFVNHFHILFYDYHKDKDLTDRMHAIGYDRYPRTVIIIVMLCFLTLAVQLFRMMT